MPSAAIPSLMRMMNERTVFECLLRTGPATCSQLAEMTGISKPTVSQAMRSLHGAGFVRPSGRSSGHLGRTGLLYSVFSAGGYAVAIDIGVRWVRVAIGDLTGSLVHRSDVETPGNDLTAIVGVAVDLVRRCLRRVKATKSMVLASVVGSPGAVDPRRPGLTHVGRLSCLDGVDLASMLGDRCGLEMTIENDVNLAALGEQACGESDENMVVFSIGHGVGAALIMDGRLMRGPRGAAGEIEAVPFGGWSQRADVLLPTSRAQMARYIARRVSALAAITDAELVVLTGDVGLDRSLLEPVRKLVSIHLEEPPRIETSALADGAVLLGGLASAHAIGLERIFSTPQPRTRST